MGWWGRPLTVSFHDCEIDARRDNVAGLHRASSSSAWQARRVARNRSRRFGTTRCESSASFLHASPSPFLSLLDLIHDSHAQYQGRQLERTPDGKLWRPFEHLPACLDQLRTQHELRKLTQHRDRDLAALCHPMKQHRGGCVDVFQWHNAVFALDTVSEKGRFGTFGGHS